MTPAQAAQDSIRRVLLHPVLTGEPCWGLSSMNWGPGRSRLSDWPPCPSLRDNRPRGTGLCIPGMARWRPSMFGRFNSSSHPGLGDPIAPFSAMLLAYVPDCRAQACHY